MMATQQIQVTVPIPEDFVLIPKQTYDDLIESRLEGIWWTMKDLENRLNRSSIWIRENVLLQPRFKNILDVENGGCVFYPRSGSGEKWSFQAFKMSKFLDQYFAEIFVKDN